MSASSVGVATPEQPKKLRGNMGALEVALTVLAFSSPLTVAWGYLPAVIYFGGVGAPISFLVAMALLLLFSVGFVAMSRGIPNPGAFYSFIAHGLHKTLGLGSAFLATLAYLLIISGITAFFGIALDALIEGFGGPSIPWLLLSIGLTIVVGVFGYIGIEFSAKTLAGFMVIELVIVTIFDVAAFFNGGAHGITTDPIGIGNFLEGNVGLGIMFAIVMFIGFEGTAVFREEARDPDKTIPRATYLSVGFIGLFYAFTTWMLIVVIGADKAVDHAGTSPADMFPGAFEGLLGNVAKDVASCFVITSVFASTLATHNIASRYVFSLGVDGGLPRFLGAAHPTQASPYRASIAVTAISFLALSVLVAAGADPGIYYARAAGVGALCLLVLMLLTTIAVLAHFRRNAGEATAWSTKVAPTLAAIGLMTVVYLVLKNANAFMATTTTLSVVFIIGITLVFVGGTLMGLYLRRRRPDVYARLGRDNSPV